MLLRNGKRVKYQYGKSPRENKASKHTKKLLALQAQNETETEGPYAVYHMGHILGKGSTGRVVLGTHKQTTKMYAVKILYKPLAEQFLSQSSKPDALHAELQILQNISHPHIVSLKEYFETDNNLYMVLEYAKFGDMLDDIMKEGKYSENQAREVFSQITQAVSYLHEHGIVHRDLKPENILIKRKYPMHVLLSDFGIARQNMPTMKTICGTVHFTAPEVWKAKESMDGCYGQEVDMWSLGIILFVMLCGKFAFAGSNEAEIQNNVMNSDIDLEDEEVSDVAKDLILGMLQRNPNKRLTIHQVKRHRWLTGHTPAPPSVGEIEAPNKENANPNSVRNTYLLKENPQTPYRTPTGPVGPKPNKPNTPTLTTTPTSNNNSRSNSETTDVVVKNLQFDFVDIS